MCIICATYLYTRPIGKKIKCENFSKEDFYPTLETYDMTYSTNR